MSKFFNFILLNLILLFSSPCLYPHGGEKLAGEEAQYSSQKIASINQSYIQNIKPIFQNKCFSCHSQFTKYPWYSKVPGIKDLLKKDVREGLKHFDFSNDFPFKGHGTPLKDLEAIEKSVINSSMPPLRYKLLHWNSGLTIDEKKTILEWISNSLDLIKE